MPPVWERRASQRIAVQLQVVETHEDSTYFQRAGNLSAGGLFLEGTMPHPPGTKVRLRFTLPRDERPIEVNGEIAAPKKDEELGMGVRFTDLSDGDRERIERFIEDLVGLPFGR
jgi:uncharacterized protein (TIGR02266 family)